MKKWQPAPEDAQNAFAIVSRNIGGFEPRKMFGYNCSFVNGNMFMGLHEVGLVLRLPEKEKEEMINNSGAKPFVPMPGKTMREYVVVPSAILNDPQELVLWVKKAYAYASSLPEKEQKRKPNPRPFFKGSRPRR